MLRLGRDRLGIKPLYLAEVAGRLRVASSLPALLAAGDMDTDLDPVALNHYVTFHAVVPAPRTILKGVRKLRPATVMCIEPDGRRSEIRYWQPSLILRAEVSGRRDMAFYLRDPHVVLALAPQELFLDPSHTRAASNCRSIVICCSPFPGRSVPAPPPCCTRMSPRWWPWPIRPGRSIIT